MAENEQGIHPEVMRHIVDLHRKHSELQMQMHDKGSEEVPHEVFQQTLVELKTLNENLSKLIPAIEADTKADKNEGKNANRRRERAGKAGVSGESPPTA